MPMPVTSERNQNNPLAPSGAAPAFAFMLSRPASETTPSLAWIATEGLETNGFELGRNVKSGGAAPGRFGVSGQDRFEQ